RHMQDWIQRSCMVSRPMIERDMETVDAADRYCDRRWWTWRVGGGSRALRQARRHGSRPDTAMNQITVVADTVTHADDLKGCLERHCKLDLVHLDHLVKSVPGECTIVDIDVRDSVKLPG